MDCSIGVPLLAGIDARFSAVARAMPKRAACIAARVYFERPQRETHCRPREHSIATISRCFLTATWCLQFARVTNSTSLDRCCCCSMDSLECPVKWVGCATWADARKLLISPFGTRILLGFVRSPPTATSASRDFYAIGSVEWSKLTHRTHKFHTLVPLRARCSSASCRRSIRCAITRGQISLAT